MRKGGSRLRITAQLIEAETGAHLWADRFEGVLEDVFEFQDRITESVVGVIEPSVLNAEIERSRAKPPESLAAYDLRLRALPHLTHPIPAEAKVAAAYLQEALRLEPNYPAAQANLAACHEIFFFWGGLDPADRIAGHNLAEAVLASRTDDANALARAGFVVWQLGQDYNQAVAAIKRALSYNPCCLSALTWGALVYAMGAQSKKAAELAERALRLSPLDPAAWNAHWALGHAAVAEDRFEDALSHYDRAIQVNAPIAVLHGVRAAALALAGRMEEVGPSVAKALELDPSLRWGPLMRQIHDLAFEDVGKGPTPRRAAGIVARDQDDRDYGMRRSPSPVLALWTGRDPSALAACFPSDQHAPRLGVLIFVISGAP